jgi:hypothetical protein
LGKVVLPAKSALWCPGSPLPAPVQCLLEGKSGGSVTLQAVLVAAPAASAPLRCLVGSWNVGNASPQEELGSWLRNPGDTAELVVVGAQECTYKERSPHASCEADWQAALQACLGPAYSCVRTDSMGQMRLSIFARFDIRAGVHGDDSHFEATGLAHMHSNKGGVATALQVWDTSLCFVNSHLAAHQGATKRRNSDYSEIVEGLQLGERGMDIMNQFHHLVWVGDLNYRLDLSDMFGEEAASAKTPPKELFDTISEQAAKGEFRELLACDQLLRARARGDAWVGFQEGAICHAPTFKVKRAEGLVFNEQRSPAFCDRILWRSLPGAEVTQEALWAAPQVASSDHKPVGSLLLLGRRPPRPAWAPRPLGPTAPVPRLSLMDAFRSNRAQAEALPTWRLQLLSLFGHDLMPADYNGLSDPYVAFAGPCLPRMAVTHVVFTTLQPSWSIDKLPTLVLVAPSEQALRTEHVLVQVVDYDRTSPDDPIGCGCIPLAQLLDCAAAGGGSADFQVPLTWAGVAAGSLNGRAKLSPGPPMPLAAFLAAKQRNEYVAPKKAFSVGRALGLVKDAPPTVHHLHEAEGTAAEEAQPGCACFAQPKPQVKQQARRSVDGEDEDD